jgi:signal transduction histidine kinase/ActR/RegA family two-component response regulator
LAALLPLLTLVVGLTIYSLRQQQSAMQQEAVAHADQLLRRVEQELQSQFRLLAVLAGSLALDSDPPDLKLFHDVATRLQRTAPAWNRVILLDLSPKQIVNTAVPFGTPLPTVVEPESFRKVLETKAPVVHGISPSGPLTPGQRHILLRMPVMDPSGRIRFVLTLTIAPETLADLVAESGVDPAWRPFLIDGSDRIVASPRSPETVAQRAGQKAIAARAAGDGGVYDGVTNEGAPVVTAFRKSPTTGWSAHVAIPLTVYNAPLTRSAWIIGLAGLAAAALTGLFVWMLRREVNANRQETLIVERAGRMEALGRMTGGVAHDFNNLLMVILGNLEMLQRRAAATPSLDRYITSIRKAAERGTQLTRELLAFSRGETKQAEVLDLGDRVQNMLAMLRQSLRGNIAVKLDLPHRSFPVRVDPIQLDLAILNIAVNARDAMPDGGTLTIRVARASFPDRSGREGILLSITDTGYGVPEEALPHVFEPFFTTKEVGKGTGLGLSQVYGFAKASHGVADIASKIGHGTTVSIYLPETKEAFVRHGPEPTEALGKAPVVSRGRVLVVDDNDDVRTVASDFLSEAGYEVQTANNASAALDALSQGGVDILVSDLIMPGELDGLGLAREARNRWPNLPMVLISGYSADAAEASRLGFELLAKPFDMTSLVVAIQKRLSEAAPRSVAGGTPDPAGPA